MMKWTKIIRYQLLVSLIYFYSDYFCSASSSPLLFEGVLETARIQCRRFMPKGNCKVKDLSKVPTWQLERDSNLRSFGRKASNLPMSRHPPKNFQIQYAPI